MSAHDELVASNDKELKAAERGKRQKRLRDEMADLDDRRRDVLLQLGSAVYADTRSSLSFRAPYEALYAEIERIDEEQARKQEEIESLNAAPAVEEVVVHAITCNGCGQPVGGRDVYCPNCGKSVAEIRRELRLCPACNAPAAEDAAVCSLCGTSLEHK